jgi:putative endonuclease
MVYHVYILSNPSGVLYIGVTNFLERRIMEHRTGGVSGFTKKYGVQRLVYFEAFGDNRTAIAREKQLKGWPTREESWADPEAKSQVCGSEWGFATWVERTLG